MNTSSVKLVVATISVMLFFSSGVTGQESVGLHLHMDKGFYVSGERIWFSTYLVEESGLPVSEGTVSVSWYSQERKQLAAQLFKVENGKASGSFLLPEDAAQGNYLCRVATANLRKDRWVLSDYLIPVISMSSVEESSEDVTEGNPESIHSALTTSGIRLKKSSIAIREDVGIRTDLASDGAFSMSVVDLALTEPFIERDHLTSSQELMIVSPSTTADLSKWNLRGKIERKDGGSIPGLVGVYWEERDTVLTVRPVNGVFTLQVPHSVGPQHFQVIDSGLFPDNDFTVSWENYPPDLNTEIPDIPPLTELSPKQKQYVYWMKRRQLLNRIFQNPGTKVNVTTEQTLPRVKPDRSYDAKSYLAFQDVESFFREVLAGAVKIDKKGAKKGFKLLNYDTKIRYEYEPLVFVDGYLLKDASQIWQIDWKNMDKLELYASQNSLAAHFGSAGIRGGVLRLYTRGKQSLFERLEFLPINEIQGLSPQPAFQLSGGGTKVPDIRPLVYWSTDLTDESEVISPSFPHSDVKGTFLIDIKGLTKEGKWISLSQVYEAQ